MHKFVWYSNIAWIKCLWSPKISWHMFENPKQERHDAKFHDGLAIKDVKATCDTTAAPKECGKDWFLILAYNCLLIGQYLANIFSLSGRTKGCLWHNIGPSGRTEHGTCWKDPVTNPKDPQGTPLKSLRHALGIRVEVEDDPENRKYRHGVYLISPPHLNGPFSLT